MLKALVKKQLMEIFAMYFIDRKTNKVRGTGYIVLYFGVFAFALVSAGLMFFGIAVQLAAPLFERDMGWLYYTMMAIMAVGLGVFGSVFNTYTSLYNAKDNDLLLSMPIPPRRILTARLVTAYILGTLFEAVAFIPAFLASPSFRSGKVLSVILPVLLVFIIGFVVLALTCILGFILALVSSKVKKSNIVTVILSLVLIGGYYFLWMNLQKVIGYIVSNSSSIGGKISSRAPVLYQLGSGALGNAGDFLIFTLIATGLLVATCAVMSVTFISIVTKSKTTAKVKYKDAPVKQKSVRAALLKKEYARFLGSANYMLNGGFGLIIMLGCAVVLIIKRGMLDEVAKNSPVIIALLPVIGAFAACGISGMNPISSPSISLEGKSIWIPKSLPVEAVDVLKAKSALQFTLNVPPALLLTVVMGVITKSGIITTALMCLMVCAYNLMISRMGVMINLSKPVLEWTNEAMPIKQSMSVFLGIIFGMMSVVIPGIVYVVTGGMINKNIFLALLAAVYFAAALLTGRRLRTKGVQLFEEL